MDTLFSIALVVLFIILSDKVDKKKAPVKKRKSVEGRVPPPMPKPWQDRKKTAAKKPKNQDVATSQKKSDLQEKLLRQLAKKADKEYTTKVTSIPVKNGAEENVQLGPDMALSAVAYAEILNRPKAYSMMAKYYHHRL